MPGTSRRAFLAGAAAPAVLKAAGPYDVVIYGGTPCGLAAAVGAARDGRRVLILEPARHIGGHSTSGINTAESEHMLHWTFGGLALEFYERLGKHYGSGKAEYYFESSAAESVYKDWLREAGVEVRFGERVEKVSKTGGAIREIETTGNRTIAARVFIDASYEGDLMARAAVSHASGREGREEFGEEAAGIRFDKEPRKAVSTDGTGALLPGISAWARDLKEGGAHRGVMNYNFRLTFAKDPALRVPIPAPRQYSRARYALLANWLEGVKGQPLKLTDFLDMYPRRNGKFEINNKQAAIISLGHFGGQFDYPTASYAERERIIADHWDYTLGLLHFLANDAAVPPNVRNEMRACGLHRAEFADNGNLPYIPYVREARRMRGEFVVSQKDVTVDRRKQDSIGISSHFIDSHHVQRVAMSPTSFVNEGRIWRLGWAYQMPYRALVPRRSECTNLLVPGAASFSHVAFCTYRLESVWMIAGHAAGVAAALASRAGRPVQEIKVEELQARLRRQRQVLDFVPGQPERWSDPRGGSGGFPEI